MDEQKTDKEQSEDYVFLKESIKKMSADKKKRAARFGWTVLFAVVFGVIAAIVFCFFTPVFENMTRDDEEAVSLLSDDQDEESGESESETVYITETQQMELTDYQTLQKKLYAVGQEANKFVVSVTSVTSTLDWFDSDYETKGIGSGVIIAETGENYFIVTEKRLIDDASQIDVTFNDGTDAQAELLSYDGNTGIAVLTVRKARLSTDTMESITVAELGNSNSISQGTMVIAVGSPLGDSFSILTGNVTAVGLEVTTADRNYKIISTDINAAEDGTGVLINLNGDIVGFIMQGYSREGYQNTITAVGISEIKQLLENLSNGITPAYFGVEISTVTADIEEDYGLPQGVYIKDVQMGSPAMDAGLQIGDVIVRMDNTEILTEEEYEDFIMNAHDGQTVTVRLKRMGADNVYQEVVCEAVLGILE